MDQEQRATLDRIELSLFNGVRNRKAEKPRAWLKEKGLTYEATGIGFNSGQMHHRKPQEFIDRLVSVGFLKPNHILSRNGKTGYMIFADYSMTFSFRDESGKVVNLYAVQIRRENQIHSLMNDAGIYPHYPHEMTKRLILCTDIIDTATILESKTLENRDAVMYIPEGKLLKHHKVAIKKLSDLKEIRLIENHSQTISSHWKA